jgi:hypothetical protein
MTHTNGTSMRGTSRGTFLMRKPLKLLRGLVIAGALLLPTTSCKLQDWLAINTNPNGPTTVAPNVYLSPMIYWMAVANPYEGRYVGRYTQMQILCCSSPAGTWDRMGYDPASDNGGIHWYITYWQLGHNLYNMINGAEALQRWDLAGVGYLMKAWGWMSATDTYGELPVKEALDSTRYYFDYDTQEYAYSEVLRLVNQSITDLKRTDGFVDATYWSKYDKVYTGDRTKWLKAAYALKAVALNHFSAKATYSASAVIGAVDSSFTSNADDFLFPYPNNQAGIDGNFQGPSRGNFPSYRQTTFVLNLMNGTVTGTADPRMTRMLAASPDGVYRGYDVNATAAITPTTAAPMNFWGYTATPALGLPTRYIFDDKTKYPFLTYAELQFIKAEAAYRSGDKATALTAYKNGVSAHLDFVNARNLDNAQSATQISAAEKAAFLADPNIIPASAAALTMTHIMTQKYIALWEWGFDEVWMDMRRFHYTDLDPATGKQVYPGFTIPTNLYPDNASKPVYRIRPRYNSEYVWNITSLTSIGAMAADYHTKPTWIVNP